MKVRLTRKFADLINGIDLSKAKAGDTIDLSPREAEILMAEGWAEFEGAPRPPAEADDRPRRRRAPHKQRSSRS